MFDPQKRHCFYQRGLDDLLLLLARRVLVHSCQLRSDRERIIDHNASSNAVRCSRRILLRNDALVGTATAEHS